MSCQREEECKTCTKGKLKASTFYVKVQDHE
jgi:hypothetical protein